VKIAMRHLLVSAKLLSEHRCALRWRLPAI